MRVTVRTARKADKEQWLALRCKLWQDGTADEHSRDIDNDIKDPVRECFVALKGKEMVGFLESSLRSIADNCCSSPVGYIEGWYVVPTARRKGVGAKLVKAAEAWARKKGCVDMASDAHATNRRSITAHKRLGYTAHKPVIRFSKRIAR